jgi:hypothetical protein
MPFTFAHPAAAIPLLRPLGRYGSLSALVIGSIAPDMAFIVPIDFTREQTHGLAALLTFCLPVGILAYLLFHALLKAPMAALLPRIIADRLTPQVFPATTGRQWSAVLVSLLCGALTHLVWDAFTHPGTPVVMTISMLNAPLVTVGGYQVYGYKLVQHGGTVMGLALLSRWLFAWLAHTAPATTPSLRALSPSRRWLTVVTIVGIAAGAGLWAGLLRCPRISDLVSAQTFMAGFVFAALPALALAITSYSLLWHAIRAPHALRP